MKKKKKTKLQPSLKFQVLKMKLDERVNCEKEGEWNILMTLEPNHR